MKKIVLAAALLCGIYFSTANILMPLFRGDDSYTQLAVNGVFAYSRDQTTYASLARDFYEGNIPGDPTVYEYKGKINPFVPLVPTALLAAMSLLSGSVSGAFAAGNFIFPVIIFLIIYMLIYRQTGNLHLSILAPVFMLIAFDYIVTPPVTLRNISYHATNILDASGPLNYFGRIPHIQMTFIFLAISVFLLYISMKKRKAFYSILCGLVSGLLFYTYFFYWTIFAGVLALHTIYFAAKKNPGILKHVVIILAVFAAVSLPFWLSYTSFDKSFLEDISTRNGKTYSSPLPIAETAKYAVIIAIFYAFSKKDYFSLLMGSIIISGIFLMNSQIITGFSIQKSHYEFAMAPFASIMMIYALWQAAEKRFDMRKIGAILFIFLFSIGFYSQYSFADKKHSLYAIDDSDKELYEWLDENTEKDDVVLTLSTEQSYLIPLYTHNNVYLPYGPYSLATTDEIWERFYISYSMLGINESHVSGMINNEETRNSYIIDHRTNTFNKSSFEIAFWDLYLFSLEYGSGIPESKKADILENYRRYLEDAANREKYRADYVLIGPYERSAGAAASGDKVWGNGKFDVYRR